MRAIALAAPAQRQCPLRLLCRGAHCGDIEIGCGGTILTPVRQEPRPVMDWVVLSRDEARAREAERSADAFLTGVATRSLMVEFRDGFLTYRGERVKDDCETLETRVDPDIVFAPYRGHRHQDHRFVADLAWSTLRDHGILECETPEYDAEPGGAPNLLVPLDDDVAEANVRHLLEAYPSEASRPWFRLRERYR